MRNDQTQLGIQLLDLQNLLDVDLVLQTAVAGNMQHADSAHLIQTLQLILGEEVINTDLADGQILGRQVQIGLQTQEAAFADLLLNLVSRLLGMRIIQCGPAGLLGNLGAVIIDCFAMAGVGEEHCLAVLTGEEEFIGLLQILNGVLIGDQRRPGNGALLTGLHFHLGGMLSQCHMAVNVKNLFGQEVLQFFLIDLLVIGGYFKQCHKY